MTQRSRRSSANSTKPMLYLRPSVKASLTIALWPQKTYPDRYGRAPVVRPGPRRQRAGSRWSQAAAARVAARWCLVETVFADGGYAGKLINWAKETTHLKLEIIKRPRPLPRFEPLPRRWVVERSFAWLIKNRRLIRDFEQRTDVAETLNRIATISIMLRRID